MVTFANALAGSAALIAILPQVQAHMALWHESVYGFSPSEDAEAIFNPLANRPVDGAGGWFFHGKAADTPSGVMSIVPGQSLTVEIACRYSQSSYGGSTSQDACMLDSGAYHAGGTSFQAVGWEGNTEDSLMGCALAIAFKPTASETRPEDFTVMSIQPTCVRQRLTSFEIPANLPACPEGGCTCAWFWSGKNSDLEMYMTGFRCDVKGGAVTTDYPVPVAPTRDSPKTGATQPLYWANQGSNLDFTPSFETKPMYNAEWNWTPGAQTGAFGAAGPASVTPAEPSDDEAAPAIPPVESSVVPPEETPEQAIQTPVVPAPGPEATPVAPVPVPEQATTVEEVAQPQNTWGGEDTEEDQNGWVAPTRTTRSHRWGRPTQWGPAAAATTPAETPEWNNYAAVEPSETAVAEEATESQTGDEAAEVSCPGRKRSRTRRSRRRSAPHH